MSTKSLLGRHWFETLFSIQNKRLKRRRCGGEHYRLPKLETAPKPVPVIETLTLVSLVAAVLALCLFAWIAQSVSHPPASNFDLSVRARIHQYASPRMVGVMIAASFLGEGGLTIACVCAFVAFAKLRWRRAVLWLVTAILGALLLNFTLKYAFHRPRPAPFFWPPHQTYDSFPSGHALFSFCVYGVIAGLLCGRIRSVRVRFSIWAFAALLVAAIGLSRIYLGMHYPSDVIAGYLAGTIWVCALVVLDRMRIRQKVALR
jgi:undecaprenyl-diphosphatase